MTFMYGGAAATAYTLLKMYGIEPVPHGEYTKERRDLGDEFHSGAADHWKFKGSAWFDRVDPGPAWKKWEDK